MAALARTKEKDIIYCLRCHALWPADALYCGRCQRSLGARICRRCAARNAPGCRACLQCGGADLTAATPCLKLRWVTRLLAWLLVLLSIRFAAYHAATVLHLLAVLAWWALATFVNVSPCLLQTIIVRLLAWLLALFLLSWMLPESLGKPLRALLARTVSRGVPLGLRAAITVAAWLRRCVEGTTQKAKKDEQKKKKAKRGN